jgi:hypothetical protein
MKKHEREFIKKVLKALQDLETIEKLMKEDKKLSI